MTRSRFWLAVLTVTFVLLLTNCSAAQTKPSVGPSRDAWVRIENPTFERLVIYEQGSGVRLGQVEALGTACMRLRASEGQTRLYARTFAGGFLIAAPPLDPRRSWLWRIHTARFDYAPDLSEVAPCGG